MKKAAAAIAALVPFCMGGFAPAIAQGMSAADNTSTTISLDGQVVMRIRTGAAGFSAGQRAEAVRHRLVPILALPQLRPRDVTVTMVNRRQSDIRVRGHLLLTVDQTLAQSNGESPQQLAEAWAANLRQALPASRAAPRSDRNMGSM